MLWYIGRYIVFFYTVILTNRQEHDISRQDDVELRKLHLNRAQLSLQQDCLHLLWSFSETPQDGEFILTKSVVPQAIDALLLPHPVPVDDYGLHRYPLDLEVVHINEAAIGCLCG